MKSTARRPAISAVIAVAAISIGLAGAEALAIGVAGDAAATTAVVGPGRKR